MHIAREVFAEGLVLIMLAVMCPVDVSAQDQAESLVPQYVNEDIEGVSALIALLPLEVKGIDEIKATLRGNWHVEETDLGFGGRYLELARGRGYSRSYVYALVYNGRVAQYVAGIEGDSHWPFIRQPIIDRWRDLSGPDVSEEGRGLVIRRTLPQALRSYQLNVAASLGPMRDLSVSPALRASYLELIDPMANTTISGTNRDDDISALVASNAWDLLENVLRGYNPGARVLAALALQDSERSGGRLSPGVRPSIDKVLNLGVEVHACVFDICSNLTARDALRWFGSDRAFPVPNARGNRRRP